MESRDQIIMVPYMGQGHLIPFMALARLIEQRSNCTVTVVTTPLNAQKLKATLPSDSGIRLHDLPFNSSDHGLPPNTESTDGLPVSHLPTLFRASQTLRPALERFVSDCCGRGARPPLCIISDFFMGWTVEVARSFGVPHSVFVTSGAYGIAVYFSLWLNLPHTKTDSDEFRLPWFPESHRLRRSQLSYYLKTADGTDLWSVLFQEQMRHCLNSSSFLVHTVEEMEQKGVEILRGIVKMPVWCIGPLIPPSSLRDRSGKPLGISIDHCVEWLNLHPPSSVLYISFGSQFTISATQTMELAAGIEAGGRPFIWVIRPPTGRDRGEGIRKEWLPPGFEERMNGRKQGLLVPNWAPQPEILSHKSTGAFLSHCGWNSVLESLSQGVPIIAWPLAAEQFYNSKMMEEEMGVCVEMARGTEDEITSERVEKMIDLVMGGSGKGAEMKRRATGFANIIKASMQEKDGKKGSCLEALDQFIIRTAKSMTH